MPITSPYSPGLSNFIDSLYKSYQHVFSLEPNYPIGDLKQNKFYGEILFTGLKSRNDLIPNDRINTRGSYEDRPLGFRFLISSTAPNAITAQKKAVALLLSLDHGIPQMKYFVAGEGTSIYDMQPIGEILVVSKQSEKPPHTWYLNATCDAVAPMEILKGLQGEHKFAPVLIPSPAPTPPPIASSPYIESIANVIASANQQFAKALELQPYSRFDLKSEHLYGLMHVRSLRTEEGRRTANGSWQRMGLGVELEIHAIASTFKTAQMLAGRMCLDLDNVIPAIKPLVEGDGSVYDFQPASDIRVNYVQSTKDPKPYIVTVSCEAVMPAIIQKARMGEHVSA